MRILYCIVLCLYCLNHSLCLAAANGVVGGSRDAAMAWSTLAVYGQWAILHNQAGMARQKGITFGIEGHQRFRMSEMTQTSLSVTGETPFGVWGVSFSRFGFDLFHENRTGLGFARNFGPDLSVGLQLNHTSINAGEGFGRSSTLGVEAGFIYEIFPDIYFAAHLSNPWRAGYKTKEGLQTKEHNPTIFRAGMARSFSPHLLIAVAMHKRLDYPPQWRAGVEYLLGNHFSARIGISTPPVQNTFGFGIIYGALEINLAATHHYILGYTPHVGMVYSLQ